VWVPEPVWSWWGIEKFSAPAGNRLIYFFHDDCGVNINTRLVGCSEVAIDFRQAVFICSVYALPVARSRIKGNQGMKCVEIHVQ
jgi:hypothetical protein